MSFNIKTEKILNTSAIKRIIATGISIRDQLENAERGLISDYDETITYTRGMACYYDNYLYKCLYTTTGTWDGTKWQKVGDELDLITKQDIEAMLGLTQEEIETLQKIINDSQITLSTTFSSSKIYTDIQQCLSDSKTYTLEQLSKKMGASYKVVTTTSEVTSTEFLYLISNSTAYDIYALIDGVATKLGNTTIDLSNYYTKTEIDNDFLKKTDANSKYATITTVDGKVDKSSILTTISSTPSDDKLLSEKAIGDTFVKKTDIVDNLTSTDTDKPLSANQGKVLKDEVDLKANDSEVVKKTDITTTIDSTSTDSEIATAKAVNDLLQTEGPGNLRIPLNEDLNNLIYNRTRVWMNSQTVEIATFTNMPSGRFTECAVIFIPYENATSDYGEQIFVGNYNRIFIRNKINTTWTAWRRVCTTSVADVPKTKIIFSDTTNYEVYNPDITTYEVVNGICYLQADVKVKNKSLTYNKVLDGIPIPKSQKNGMASAWNSNNTNANLLFEIRNGALFLAYGEPSQHHLINIAYPVENS